ncbi:unnamed protein product [Merluccius merluccius]
MFSSDTYRVRDLNGKEAAHGNYRRGKFPMCSRSPPAASRRQATNDDNNNSSGGGGGVSSSSFLPSFLGGHLTAGSPDMLRNGQLSGRPRTDVWRYFVYSEKKDRTRCAVDFCGTVLPGRDAAHLRRHLQLIHPAIYAMVQDDGYQLDSYLSGLTGLTVLTSTINTSPRGDP